MDGCPMCGGPGVVLGTLGSVTWLRCCNCGWDFPASDAITQDDDFASDPDDDGDDE